MNRLRLFLGIGSLVLLLAGAALLRWLDGATAPAAAGPLARGGRPVLFVGLDGADWELLDRYMAAGTMPNLAALAREGRHGTLTTIHPPLSPLVWTTMMTGVSPLQHGILDFTRFHPGTGQRGPITSDERRVPAVWNVVDAAGGSVAVFGMWATYPAEPVHGVIVSDRLFSFQRPEAVPPKGVVHPRDREEWAREALRRTEGQVGFEALRDYLPWLDEADYPRLVAAPDPYAKPVSALLRILVETRVYHALAASWLKEHRPDLTVVYLQGTDVIGHVFAAYLPPRQPTIPEEDFRRYGGVPERYFREIDGLLGEYREWARAAGAVLVIASDHGFFWGAGRPSGRIGTLAATAGKWHRDEGIFLLWGPGIGPGHGERAGAAEVCATLLALIGLPPGIGHAGPPLGGVRPVDRPPVDYGAGYHPLAPEAPNADPEAIAEEISKLRALGYIGGVEATSAPMGSRSTRTAASHNNEGLILRERGRTAEAEAAFERALQIDPRLASALWNLSDLFFAGRREPDKSDELLIRALAAGLPDGAANVGARATGQKRAGEAERSRRLLDGALAARDEPALRMLRGRDRIEARDCAGALADFDVAVSLSPGDALAHASRGLARLCLGEPERAARDFRRSLELDPDQPEIRRYLER